MVKKKEKKLSQVEKMCDFPNFIKYFANKKL